MSSSKTDKKHHLNDIAIASSYFVFYYKSYFYSVVTKIISEQLHNSSKQIFHKPSEGLEYSA